MTRLRRALGPCAAAWILCQAATLTIVPVVLSTDFARAAKLECRCSHGDHTFCPMHHKPAPGSRACLMQGTGDSDLGVLGSLLGVAGFVPVSSSAIAPAPAHVRILIDITPASRRSAPPDPPPPRA